MDIKTLSEALASVEQGKRVGTSLYLHVCALQNKPDLLGETVATARRRAGLELDGFNVIKFDLKQGRVSLLDYPDFMERAFPLLAASWSVSLDTGEVTVRRYSGDGNQPVLHRKELLIPKDHPQRGVFEALTSAAEKAGLFEDTHIIGHRAQWEEELRARGFKVEGHTLVPLTEDEKRLTVLEGPVLRHKTAISRRNLSTPMQSLWRHGFLDGRYTVFDYGCGRGDDLRALGESGLEATGWDPHFRAEGEKIEADVVNIGFVINVIEDPQERREALEGAFALTRHILAVAALIGGRTAYEKHRLFRDGVLTSIGTFQKYYTQAELGQYITDALDREPIAIAPGVYFIFKTDEGEQAFLEQRSRRRVLARRPMPRAKDRPRPERTPRPRRQRKPTKWEAHAELLESFWVRCIELGRLPEPGEFLEEGSLREHLGTPKRVLNHLAKQHGEEALSEAREAREGDILVYLALNFFERRKSFSALSSELKRDIRAFWGSYKAAQAEAQRMLFSVGDPEVILIACREAYEQEAGHLDGSHSLQFHSALAGSLPAVLRIYMGCASKLYGEVEEADMVKIHIQSGKLSLMSFDDFENKPVPMLIERVKIDLRRQRIEFFDYGDTYKPQPLYLKSRFIYEGFPHHEKQAHFDSKLEALALFDFEEHGPDFEMFVTVVEARGLKLDPWEG